MVHIIYVFQPLRTPLTKEHVELILMAASGSCRKVAMDFKRKHGKHITQSTVAELINNFKMTGSGDPRTATEKGTTAMMLAHTLPYIWRLFGHPVALNI